MQWFHIHRILGVLAWILGECQPCAFRIARCASLRAACAMQPAGASLQPPVLSVTSQMPSRNCTAVATFGAV